MQENVKFTVVVASKRHHIRFFPKDGDRNGNPLPGTLVERDITHPFEYDFCRFLISAIIYVTANANQIYALTMPSKVQLDQLTITFSWMKWAFRRTFCRYVCCNKLLDLC